MSIEIERKFLLRGEGWREAVRDRISIRQAYLSSTGKSSVRIRIKNDQDATLTVKSKPTSLRRLELEYKVPLLDAEALMMLRQGSVIEKTRHIVPWEDNLKWEIDAFFGENAGLVIAEIELRDPSQRFRLPEWIGEEITGHPNYYNSALVMRPFGAWPKPSAELSA